MKRKFKITLFVVSTILLILGGLFLILNYINLSKPKYVKYTEDSKIDNKVIYKENSFFDDKELPQNNKYIASLIDKIKTDFNYNISFLNKKINYNYKYKIVATVSVLDNEDKEKIFENNETIYESKFIPASNHTSINKSINVDYNKYNDLINSFKNTYSLKDAESKLTVSMYVNVKSSSNSNIENLNKNAVISFSMPLTTRTTGISLSSDLTKNKDRKLIVKSSVDYTYLLIIGVIVIIIAIIEAVIAIVYYMKTRTIKNIYDRDIKRLLNNYEGYIQKINSKYEIGASQVIKVESFNDMLEIRDTLKTPILMLENEAKDGTFFIIPAANGIIYAYALRIADIIARKEGMDAPDYDLNNIDQKLPKKYTLEFIDKQIEETRSLKVLDYENTIMGTKDKDADLYEQLDKTITMKPIKLNTKKSSSKKKATKNNKTNKTAKTKKKDTRKNKMRNS